MKGAVAGVGRAGCPRMLEQPGLGNLTVTATCARVPKKENQRHLLSRLVELPSARVGHMGRKREGGPGAGAGATLESLESDMNMSAFRPHKLSDVLRENLSSAHDRNRWKGDPKQPQSLVGWTRTALRYRGSPPDPESLTARNTRASLTMLININNKRCKRQRTSTLDLADLTSDLLGKLNITHPHSSDSCMNCAALPPFCQLYMIWWGTPQANDMQHLLRGPGYPRFLRLSAGRHRYVSYRTYPNATWFTAESREWRVLLILALFTTTGTLPFKV